MTTKEEGVGRMDYLVGSMGNIGDIANIGVLALVAVVVSVVSCLIYLGILLLVIKWLFKEFWRAKYRVDAEQQRRKKVIGNKKPVSEQNSSSPEL